MFAPLAAGILICVALFLTADSPTEPIQLVVVEEEQWFSADDLILKNSFEGVAGSPNPRSLYNELRKGRSR